jgi:LCP family protein required for cell wall assembly
LLAEAALAVVVPGWSAVGRRRVLGVVLLVAGLGLPAGLVGMVGASLLSGRSWLAMSLDAGLLGWVLAVVVVALLARLAAVAELWLALNRPSPTDRRTLGAIAVTAALLSPLVLSTVGVARARAHIAPAFDSPTDGPLYDASEPVTSTTVGIAPTTTTMVVDDRAGTTVPVPSSVVPTTEAAPGDTVRPLPARPLSGLDPMIRSEITTILLLGGDAGPGRSGLRTDSMILLSIHVPSGRAALISVSRDLDNLLFPPGSALADRYPYGFTEIANAVYPIVSSNPQLRDAYQVGDVRPGVVGIAQGIGYSLDVTINDYVLIDMQGFLDLIDALGGVTLTLNKAIPMPGNVPGARTQYPDTIGPGTIHMDGSTALGFVRSRKGDSDYQRTRRQRQLLAALATQISLRDVIGSFNQVTSAIGGTLRTSLDPDELTNILALIGGETAIVESVGLVPPLVRPSNPDYGEIARIVGEVHLALATGVDSGY